MYPAWLSNLQFLLRILTFTFNGVHGPAGLGDFWSLTTEMQFYILVPTLAVLMNKLVQTKRLKYLGILIVFCVGISIWYLTVSHYGYGFKFWNPYIYTPFYENLDIF